MATLTVSEVNVSSGLNLTDTAVAAASGGDEFANDGNTLFVVLNGGAGTPTITFTTPETAGRDALAVADPAVAITASDTWVFGPFEPGVFNDANGRVGVTYSSETDLTVIAVKLKY